MDTENNLEKESIDTKKEETVNLEMDEGNSSVIPNKRFKANEEESCEIDEQIELEKDNDDDEKAIEKDEQNPIEKLNDHEKLEKVNEKLEKVNDNKQLKLANDNEKLEEANEKLEKDNEKLEEAKDKKESISLENSLKSFKTPPFLNTNNFTFPKNENIFLKSGTQKKKEQSIFLQNNLDVKKTQAPGKQQGWVNHGRLLYFEDDEWIPMGDGEVILRNGRFVFIRDGLKTVILDFSIGKEQFTKEDDFLCFTANGRKSTGTSYEVIDRNYRVEFRNSRGIEEFFNVLEEEKI